MVSIIAKPKHHVIQSWKLSCIAQVIPSFYCTETINFFLAWHCTSLLLSQINLLQFWEHLASNHLIIGFWKYLKLTAMDPRKVVQGSCRTKNAIFYTSMIYHLTLIITSFFRFCAKYKVFLPYLSLPPILIFNIVHTRWNY